MKRVGTCISALLAAGLLFAAGAAAQRGVMWRGSGGWGPGTEYGRMYDPKTVETISGAVVSVDRITPRKGMASGVHLVLKTAAETLPVHLGPSWYLENQDVKLEPKDRVEVRGSRILFGGKAAMIAAEVRKGDDTLVLRDAAGFPVWSGWRRH